MVKQRGFWKGSARKEIGGKERLDWEGGLASPRLYFLARFLNLDLDRFEGFDEEDDPMRIALGKYLSRPGVLEAAMNLQNKLAKEIWSITRPHLSTTEIDQALWTLVNEINALGLKIKYELHDGEEMHFLYKDTVNRKTGHVKLGIYDRLAGKPGEPVPNYATKYRGPDCRTLKIGKGKWIVKSHFHQTPTLTEEVYSTVVSALQLDGSDFGRLRKCAFCHQFFVAEDNRQIYCSEECRRDSDLPTVKDRKRKSRELKAEM